MLKLEELSTKEFSNWDCFIDNSVNGTIFQKLSFLSYHGDKFERNINHLIIRKGEKIFALLPLAIFNSEEGNIARSPFGASWGGLVHGFNFSLKDAIWIVSELKNYLKAKNVKQFFITPPPPPYFKKYTSFFEFALLNDGFEINNRDIIHVVDLFERENTFDIIDSKCRNQVRKGNQLFDVIINANVEAFYPILKEDKQRLNASITHSQEDLRKLSSSFKEVFFDIAINKFDSSKAGICYFKGNSNSILTFYMAQETEARGKNGLNVLINKRMEIAKNEGIRFFDFGTSSINSKINNIGIAEFKESFGANGFFRDTYKIEIN